MRTPIAALLCLWAPLAFAQEIRLPGAGLAGREALARAMPALAREVIPLYREDDREKYLDNLFRLQMVAGRPRDALRTIETLRALGTGQSAPMARAINVQYEVLARAGPHAASAGAFARAFRETVRPLDDQVSALVLTELNVDRSGQAAALEAALGKQKGKETIALPDALALLRAYQVDQAYGTLTALSGPLIAEEDARRYVVSKDVLVKTADGASVCALVVRPRKGPARLPALLEFVIYVDQFRIDRARRAASHGYAGVEGFTRGKACSPDAPVPFEHDGADAASLIDWIAAQPWSDGRVGMYGGSYSGFTPWAAARHKPKALKALMSSASGVPGLDTPMEGNIFQTFSYYWPFYAASNKTLDEAPLRDRARWDRMQHDWYLSGRPYRELEKIDGTPNPIFSRWLEHPAYDAYWQAMTTSGDDFAAVDIPVLTTTGYYDGAEIGALHYFIEHHARNPRARHYLLIGPYDHVGCQLGPISVTGVYFKQLRGYTLDPVALIDVSELRFQWFDFVLRGQSRPALLQDTVNYEVMGANVWAHKPSLEAMGHPRRFYLSAARSKDAYSLSATQPSAGSFLEQKVDFADRGDASRVPPTRGDIVDPHLDSWNGVVFVSEPFPGPIELSGLFSGQLELSLNKKDVDLSIQLYELTPKGEYVELSFYQTRASYNADRSHRQLLTPGQRQKLPFKSERLTSIRFQPGSRLVAVLGVFKNQYAQINYGTGKDVSDESIADAKEPLVLQWYGESFIEVPVSR